MLWWCYGGDGNGKEKDVVKSFGMTMVWICMDIYTQIYTVYIYMFINIAAGGIFLNPWVPD
jgi:hypothetical protein